MPQTHYCTQAALLAGPAKGSGFNTSTHPSAAGVSGKRSCFLPLAACDKQRLRMDRAVVGTQEGEVCVIPSAWESHREMTRLLFKSLAGSTPPPKPAPG